MTMKQVALGALIVGLGGSTSATAAAEDAAAQLSAEAPASARDAAEDEREKDPMGWIGLGVKLGVAGIGEGEVEVNGVTSKTPSRTGLQLAVPINLGGDGFGWIIEPYLTALASVEKTEVDLVSGTSSTEDVGVTAYGVYTGPKFDIHVMDPLYVGFGFGLKMGWVSSDAFDAAADVYGRVPVHATYYLMDDLGLVAELGLGYGVSGYAAAPYQTVDPSTGMTKVIEPDLDFGSAFTWDLTAGVRWP